MTEEDFVDENDPVNQNILRLYNQKLSFRTIADRLDISVGTVSNRIRTMSNRGICKLRGRQDPSKMKGIPSTPSVAEEGEAPISAAAIAVIDVRRNECRWPIGDPFGDDFHYCCLPIVRKRFDRNVPNNRYCDMHTKEAYTLGRRIG